MSLLLTKPFLCFRQKFAFPTHLCVWISIIIIIIYLLTARVAGAPQMILQPVSSIFLCYLSLCVIVCCVCCHCVCVGGGGGGREKRERRGEKREKVKLYLKAAFLFLIIVIIVYLLTVRVTWAAQMISQPVFSIFPCSPLPSGTWQTPDLSIS